jgi:hypothetical protein
MEIDIDQKNKRVEAFNKMPKPIRDWLLSDETSNLIAEINKRIETEEIMSVVIPKIVGLISIGELPPENLALEISNYFTLSEDEMGYIVKEIKEKIFRPIAADLLKIGVDINKIRTPITTMKQELLRRAQGIIEGEQAASAAGYGELKPVQLVKPFVPSVPQQQKQFIRKEITNEQQAASDMGQGTDGVEKFRIPNAEAGIRKQLGTEEVNHPKPFILHEERPVAPPQVPPPAPPIRQAPPVPKTGFDSKQEVRIPIKKELGSRNYESGNK